LRSLVMLPLFFRLLLLRLIQQRPLHFPPNLQLEPSVHWLLLLPHHFHHLEEVPHLVYIVVPRRCFLLYLRLPHLSLLPSFPVFP